MKLYRLNLLHNGKQNHQMVKEGVTAPEVILLMGVHGPQAVTDVKETGENRNIAQAEEKRRLVFKYGQRMFTQIFPGFAPNLPYGLEQVGIQAEAFQGELPFQVIGKTVAESAKDPNPLKEAQISVAPKAPVEEPAAAPQPAFLNPAQSDGMDVAPQPFGKFNIPQRAG